jgi:serine/threonine protein kinase
VLQSFERLRREEGDEAVVRQIERHLEGAGDADLPELLRRLGRLAHPAAVPALFRYLPHACTAVREQARRALQAIGWEKSLAAVEALARGADAAAGAALLDGLAVFEARGDLVRVLDRLSDVFQGDLRVRALQLLEHKRLGLDLEKTAEIFRQVRSPYRLQRVLGQGLFTASYLARDEAMDLEVVVRVLRPEFACRSEIRRSFLDLCRKAIHYHHPNLAHTLEVRLFPEQDVYYIVRQYISGLTLQEVLARGRQFEPPQVLEVLRQLLGALSELHPQVIHGAVKPSNVFVCSGDKVVLGDLSLPPSGVGETLRQRLAYDYRYAAPEALVGAAVPASDFYALGCVAYELVCGAPPFVSDHYNEVLVQHATRPVPPPRQHCPGLPPVVEALLLRLLAKDVGLRPASVAEALWRVDEAAGQMLHGTREPSAELSGPAEPPGVRLLRDASLAEFRPPHTMFSMGASRSPEETVPPEPAQSLPSHAASAERSPPESIGRYEILGQLGRGGMGVVYKARDTALQRDVALKVLANAGLTGAAAERFRAEARAAARLHHPNIVQIYDIGEHEGSPYLALEYVSGGTLAEKLRHQALPPQDAAALLIQVARGVHAAHQAGILHRDLKPGNILLSADGTPKLTDFGLAKVNDASLDTPVGTIMGTAAYMSPEQAGGGAREIGPATDIYGLGAILYECLTGEPPFGRTSSVHMLLMGVLHEAPRPPRGLRPEVPPDLERICLACLEKDPAHRYVSAAALAEHLESFLADEPLASLPVREASTDPAEKVEALPASPVEQALQAPSQHPPSLARSYFRVWVALGSAAVGAAATALWYVFH